MAETKTQDAIQLLEDDHRKVKDLFQQFETADGDGRKQEVAKQICLELTVHAMLEEQIFYPALEGKVEEDLLKESLVEHDGAKILIAEIEGAEGADDEFFEAKVKVLQEQIEHHVAEEEEGGDSLFSQARKADVDLQSLGEQMTERKGALVAQFRSEGVPTPELTTITEAQI